MSRIIEEFLAGLAACDDKASLSAHIARFTRALGIDFFSYYWVPLLGVHHGIPKVSSVPSLVISGFPQAWQDYYLAGRCRESDPVLQACLGTALPIVWRDHLARSSLTPAERTVIDVAREHGVGAGITVPIHGFGGDFAACTFCPNADRTDADRAMVAFHHDLHIAALHFHEAVKRVLDPAGTLPRVQNLTSREIDVLLWINEGKSYWDISSILGISEHTVESHVRNAMRKLEVHTSRHAAAIVAQLSLGGLKSPPARARPNGV